MSKPNTEKISLDKLLGVLALAVGMVALFFSWKANRIAEEANSIASQQLTAQVVVLSSDYNGGGFQKSQDRDQYSVRCRQVIRLSNLGGAATALVGYEAEIHYKDAELRVSSEDASVVSTETVSPTMRNFQFVFLDKDTLSATANFDRIDPEYYFPFPAQIDAFTTMDIDSAVSFLLDGNYGEGEIDMPQYVYQYEHPESVYGLPALEVVYTFKTASGQTITTPRTLCLWLK
jgi:hypothetical protein